MYKKKIAIYVEGHTEQVLINYLILARWNHMGVAIRNIKLQSYQDQKCRMHDTDNDDAAILFLITDVDGVGSLASAIASRANNQQKNEFEIIGLRDLSAQDFNQLPCHIDRMGQIAQTFKKALQIKGCKKAESVELFFAVMTVEAWLLAFTKAVSKWAKISAEEVLQQLPKKDFEEISAPSTVLKKIGETARKKDPKSFGEVVSLASGIASSEIEEVYKAKKIPSFNKFWDRLLLLDN